MAFLVLFVSCEQYDDDIFNDSIKTNQVTGKELFKSIFFGYGSIGGQISILEKKSSSIKRFSKEETQEFEKNMETLLTEIELNSPDFFNFFELKIVSNNHQLIEEAIYEGTKEIVDNIHVIIPNFNEIVSTVEDDIKQGRIEINDNDDIERYAAQLENSKYDDLLDKNMISSKGQMVCTWVLACALAGRWEEVRKPNTKELKATKVIAIPLEEVTAKVRSGGSKDDPADDELALWAGVVPIKEIYEAPIADSTLNKNMELPKSVTNLYNLKS